MSRFTSTRVLLALAAATVVAWVVGVVTNFDNGSGLAFVVFGGLFLIALVVRLAVRRRSRPAAS